jgi:hypothetical protein
VVIAYVILGMAIVGTISSTIVFVLAVLGTVQFRRSARLQRKAFEKFAAKMPPVSVLEPMHGNEARLKENIESFFRQNYAEYEVLFAADEPDDPALPVIREICACYPHIPSQILVTGQPPWPNAPNYCFHRLIEVAAHDILVTSDSDVEVESGLFGYMQRNAGRKMMLGTGRMTATARADIGARCLSPTEKRGSGVCVRGQFCPERWSPGPPPDPVAEGKECFQSRDVTGGSTCSAPLESMRLSKAVNVLLGLGVASCASLRKSGSVPSAKSISLSSWRLI